MSGIMTADRSKIITLTETDFWKKVLDSPCPFLIEIGADWCGACDIMAPVLERLAFEYEGKIKFGRLDIDSNEPVAREFGVNDLPFLLFF